MTTKLEVLRAELEALEADGAYDAPQYDWLVSEVDKLETEEKTTAPTTSPMPATAPAGDPEADLAERMRAMHASPHKYTDDQRAAIIREYNAAVIVAGQPQPERVDVQTLTRDLVTANADPSALDDAARSDLVSRFNRAARQRPERRTTEALRADLAGSDLGARMRAARQLQERGELDDAQAAEMVQAYNAEVVATATARANLDPAAYPELPAEVVEGLREARQALERPTDPVEVAVGRFNDFVRAQRPPTPEETLAALGVEPEPVSISTTSAEEA